MDLRTGRSEFLLPTTHHLQEVEDISPDGRRLTYSERTDGGFSNLWTLPLDGSTAPVPLHRSQFDQEGFRFAPDGRHYSFISNESGRSEVYVSSMDGGSKIGISANGGSKARWSADGRELYYVSSDRRLMSVPIRAGQTLEIGTPVTLFAMASMAWLDYDVSRDGQRFLALIPETSSAMQPLTAVQHWQRAAVK